MYAYLKTNYEFTFYKGINFKKLTDILEILLVVILLCSLSQQQAANLHLNNVSYMRYNNLGNVAGETNQIPGINQIKNPIVRILPANPAPNISVQDLLQIQPAPTAAEESVKNAAELYEITVPSEDILPRADMITPKPEVTLPNPGVISSEPEIALPASDVVSPRPEIALPNPGIISSEPEIIPPNPHVVIPDSEITPPNPSVTNPEPEITPPGPSVITPEPEIITPEPIVNTKEPEIIPPNPEIITDKDPEIVPPEQTLISEEKKDISDETDTNSGIISGTDQNTSDEEIDNPAHICNGFILNSSGMIIGCHEIFIVDGVLCLPSNEACNGIAADALSSLDMQVYELYIPANIITIEEGAFNSLTELLYTEVHPDNPVYASNEGILYKK